MKSDAPREGIPLKFGLMAQDAPNLAETSEVHLDPDQLQESQPGPGDHEHEDFPEPRLRDMPVTLWNVPRILLLALIRLYQVTFSRALPADTCRFYPSCSHYGYQAIYKYGAIKGGLMAAWRVLRCNPFNRGGFDPVP